MKKLFILVAIIVVCCFAFAGCGSTNEIAYVGDSLDFGGYDINERPIQTFESGGTLEHKSIKEIVGDIKKSDVKEAVLKDYAKFVYRNNNNFDINTFDTNELSYTFRFLENKSFSWYAYSDYIMYYAILETPNYGFIYRVIIRDGEISNTERNKVIYSV